jgi:DNA-binding MurR/RpiR family transcriptional regulator
MSCLGKMRAVHEELSANEKMIADFILENSALIRDYSSQNLAAAVGVSQSSIIKFSQKLNYRGFTDLKLAIHESVVKNDKSAEFDEKNGFDNVHNMQGGIVAWQDAGFDVEQ